MSNSPPASAPITKAVMMLQGPPMDKVVALALVCKHELGIDPSDPKALKALYIVFEHTHPDMKGHVLDIDVTERYHGLAGSATEMVARRLGLLELPGIETVLRDVNSNNNGDQGRKLRGGWLKGLNWSFVKLVREAYTFPHDESSHTADATWRASVSRVSRWRRTRSCSRATCGASTPERPCSSSASRRSWRSSPPTASRCAATPACAGS